MLNFPKIPKIALRKFSELSHTLWRSKRDFRVKLTFFWVALHIIMNIYTYEHASLYNGFTKLRVLIWHITRKNDSFWFFIFFKCPHDFLSAIFGILGKFGIGVGSPKKIDRKKFHRKKN